MARTSTHSSYGRRTLPTRKSNQTNPYATLRPKEPEDNYEPSDNDEVTDDEENLKPRAKSSKSRAKGKRQVQLSDSDDELEDESSTDNIAINKLQPKKLATVVILQPKPAKKGNVASKGKGKQSKTKTTNTVSSTEGSPIAASLTNAKEKRRVEDADGHQKRKHKDDNLDKVKELQEEVDELNRKLQVSLDEYQEVDDECNEKVEQNTKLRNQLERLRGLLEKERNNAAVSQAVEPVASDDIMLKPIKQAVKQVYRMVKFLNTTAQQTAFGEMVMDALDMEELNHFIGETDENKLIVAGNRANFQLKYKKEWTGMLNDQRNYAQVNDR